MRLSEAIRLGALLKRQWRGAFYSATAEATCAIGAALDAIGSLHQRVAFDEAVAHWPILLRRGVAHPVLRHSFSDVLEVIFDLNDECHWTRERIADWVATIEAAEVPERDADEGARGQPVLIRAGGSTAATD